LLIRRLLLAHEEQQTSPIPRSPGEPVTIEFCGGKPHLADQAVPDDDPGWLEVFIGLNLAECLRLQKSLQRADSGKSNVADPGPAAHHHRPGQLMFPIQLDAHDY
jgi:hypothetical protein